MTSSELKQSILAMMWGDAYVDLNQMSGKARLDIYHCADQLPLLQWKKEVLEQVTGITCSIKEKVDNRLLVGGNTRIGYRLQTNFSHYLGKLARAPTKHILKQLVKPQALAILWQDDGTLVFSSDGHYSTATLCVDGWEVEEVKYFRSLWNNHYGWCPEWMDYKCRGKTYPRLRMRKKEMQKLSGVIKSHIHPCMDYKILNP